jgi:hypothetical protein
MRTCFLITPVLALAGCAASYHEPALPAGHPANPAAESAAVLPASQTLALPTEAAAVSAPRDADRGGASTPHQTEHGHGATGIEPGEPLALYACPMHPEVTSDTPGQRCTKCGMWLVSKEGEKEP